MSQPNASQQQQSKGPPYASKVASTGGLPSVIPDVPVCAVLLCFYIGFAITNMTIFQPNRRRKYKFLPTVFIFGFCMSRLATLVLRITWATRQHNVRLAIAANVFVNAGILILYLLNLIFTQRILRATHPKIGWHAILSITFKVFYAAIGAALAMVITAAIIGAYTLNTSTLEKVRDVQLAAITFLLIFVTLPLVLLALAHFLPHSSDEEHFGQGSMTKKKVIVLLVACLLITIAGFKAGTAWMPPHPITKPAWYHSKASFYIFNFALEITVLFILTLSRPDKGFHVPNGSKGPGDYTRLSISAGPEITREEREMYGVDKV